MTLEVPDWCVLGKWVAWSDEQTTGCKWVGEEIVAYGIGGFFHKGSNCPMYFTEFSEYGKTVKELEEVDRCLIVW